MSRPWAEPSHTNLRRAPTPSRRLARHSRGQHEPGEPMKVLLWIVLIIFLIGLAVVLGIGKLIF